VRGSIRAPLETHHITNINVSNQSFEINQSKSKQRIVTLTLFITFLIISKNSFYFKIKKKQHNSGDTFIINTTTTIFQKRINYKA